VSELITRKQQEATANDHAVLSALAAAGDAGVTAGGLASLVTLAPRTTSEVVSRLVTRGLACRAGRRRIWATAAGRSEAGSGTVGLAPALDVALACLPAEALRAFARLQLAAVPARWHLAGEHDIGWSGFIALGPTKTGKTSIAQLVCRVYGVKELSAIKAAFRETPGSLVGRREKDGGSATGWRAEPSPALELPYLCIDEWDKASREVQAAAGGLLLGDSADELEGERVKIRPTVYVTLNTGRDGLRALHGAHVRRSVVLDTTPLRPLLADIDEDMRRLFGGEAPIPRLRLDRSKPAPALPDELRNLLRSELRAGLTQEGWQHTDVEPLARVALGRVALTSGVDLERAVLATALDYLTCAATLGHTLPGFASHLAGKLGAGALMPDAGAAEEELEHRRTAQASREHKAATARLAFRADRERAAATALAARDAMGRAQDPDRQAIASALTTAAEDLRAARTSEALENAVLVTLPYIKQAQAWMIDRDKALEESARLSADRRRQRERESDARRAQRNQSTRTRRPVAPRGSQASPTSADLPAALASALGSLRPSRASARASSPARAKLGVCPTCATGAKWRMDDHWNGKCPGCQNHLVPVGTPQ